MGTEVTGTEYSSQLRRRLWGVDGLGLGQLGMWGATQSWLLRRSSEQQHPPWVPYSPTQSI